MKTKLLRKLRRKYSKRWNVIFFNDEYYISIKTVGGKYLITEDSCPKDKCIHACNEARRDDILSEIHIKVNRKRNKKISKKYKVIY